MPYHLSKADFALLVEQALGDVPEPFAQILQEIPVEIRQRPTPAQLTSAALDRDDLLLGLYHGRPLTHRSVMDSPALPDVIYIFQENIELACEDEENLIQQVRTTVLHEIGHHFGMTEHDLDDLGYG
jgi:predicted Zn-dependent protease with MMP-like domain